MPAVLSWLSRALNPWGALRIERQTTALYMALATDAVEMAVDRLGQYRSAACDLADLFDDGMLASHIADKLTCSEAESLADFFRAVDHPHVADLWLECHAEGDDDEDDLHYQGERSELALVA
ncbi:hypothetical protein [Streptomyces sp. WZ.A104]|uniref:hypothetical protein n=1 Tax=Streptomyces sp. WZ.A104 TaxID=2023771 RepID=UPI0011806BF2|nr:hypothetical protein [Streptomyces sp. WZ.A104]